MSGTIKMTGRLLIFDKVDKIGIMFPKDCKITYPEEVPFIINFAYDDPDAVLGLARIRKDERGLLCDVELDIIKYDVLKYIFKDKLPIGGYYNKGEFHIENGIQVIASITLVGISTASAPADDELNIRVVEE